MKAPPARARDAGFTLIELLVAIAVAGLALAALFALFSTDLRAAREAETRVRATLLAQSLLDELAATPPRQQRVEGRSGDGFRWQASIVPYAVVAGDPAFALYELRVTVAWNERGGGIELATLRGAPVAP